MKDTRIQSLAALCVLALGAGAAAAQEPAETQEEMDPFPRVRVETTAGAFTLELFAERRPAHGKAVPSSDRQPLL